MFKFTVTVASSVSAQAAQAQASSDGSGSGRLPALRGSGWQASLIGQGGSVSRAESLAAGRPGPFPPPPPAAACCPGPGRPHRRPRPAVGRGRPGPAAAAHRDWQPEAAAVDSRHEIEPLLPSAHISEL
jgi:hypothetical protein